MFHWIKEQNKIGLLAIGSTYKRENRDTEELSIAIDEISKSQEILERYVRKKIDI